MRVVDRAKDVWERLGPRTVDVCGILLGLLVTASAMDSKPRWVDLPLWVIGVAGALGSVSLWWRRRWPVQITLGGIAVLLLSGNPIPLIAGLFTTALMRRDRVLIALTVAAGLAFSIRDFLDAPGFDLGIIASGMAGALLIIAAGAYFGARRDLLASLRDRADRAESERELRAEQAKAGERARIAREMHDVLAHKVSLIALHAGALEVNADAGPARVEEAAALIRTTAHQTLEELREVLGVLRSEAGPEGTDLAPTATAADITRLIESSRAAGLVVELSGTVPEFPDATARAVYRVVQEGMTNVLKHARGAATVVTITGDAAAGVSVAVVNRRPVAPELLAEPVPGSGAGLVGLAERIRLLGGTFHGGPEPDGGFALRAWFPWADGAPHVLSELDSSAAEIS